MTVRTSPVARIFNLVKLERREITAVYFYAIMNGLMLLAIPVSIQALIGFAQTTTASASVVVLIILAVSSVLMAGILQVKQMQLIEKIQQKIFVRYSFSLHQKIPQIRMSAVADYYMPELFNRFFDIGNLQKSLAKLMLDFPLAIIQIAFGLVLLSFYHPMFIAFGFLLLLVICAILYFSGTAGLQKSIEESNYKYKVAAWLQEMARMVRMVKFSKNNPFLLHRTDDNIAGYLEARTAHFRILLLQYKTLIVFKTLVTTAMLIVGTVLLLQQQLNVGQFIAAEIVILTIINSVEKLISNLDSVYDVLTAVEKIEQVTDKETETSGTILLPEENRGLDIKVKDLSFRYPGSDNQVLKDISFEVKANEKICIQGEEGSGKSTLVHLLAGAGADFSGSIIVNGLPLENYKLQSLRAVISMAIGSKEIFAGTLKENICMGAPAVDLQYLQELCEQVGFSSFINSLPLGLDTKLSATGRNLPGHARRKIILIRALLNKPRLLLLEEPWVGLEEKNRQQIMQLLLNLRETTVIAITNDAVFAQSCNKRILLEKNGCSVIENAKPGSINHKD